MVHWSIDRCLPAACAITGSEPYTDGCGSHPNPIQRIDRLAAAGLTDPWIDLDSTRHMGREGQGAIVITIIDGSPQGRHNEWGGGRQRQQEGGGEAGEWGRRTEGWCVIDCFDCVALISGGWLGRCVELVIALG